MKYILIYLILINFYALILMYMDKYKSRKGKWRIPEAKLFKTAFLFGSIGIFLGMQLFRHKTRHNKFVFGIPAVIIVQAVIIYWLYAALIH